MGCSPTRCDITQGDGSVFSVLGMRMESAGRLESSIFEFTAVRIEVGPTAIAASGFSCCVSEDVKGGGAATRSSTCRAEGLGEVSPSVQEAIHSETTPKVTAHLFLRVFGTAQGSVDS